MTVSVAKGKSNESSSKHNDRKTNLENAPEEKRKKFYEQVGHQHIHEEYTYLNEDYIKDPIEIYNKEFEEAIKEYNAKQKRNDRKIGEGKALTVKEKKDKVIMLEYVDQYKKLNKNQKTYFLNNLPEKAKKPFTELQKAYAGKSLRDVRRDLTRAKHAPTLGEAYYKKQKHSKQASTHVEFVFQIGNAEDFNEIDKNGRIVRSYDRTDPNGIWQKSKKVLKKFEKKFEEKNPNLIVTNWSIHMDESTPHLHLQAVPIAETDKTLGRGKDKIDKTTGKVIRKARRNGLAKKVSLDGALECEGYTKDVHDSRKMFTQWQHDTADELAKIMQEELGVTRRKGVTNRLKDVHEYKQVKEEIAKNREKSNNLQKKIDEKNDELANVQNTLMYTNDDLSKVLDDMQSQDKMKKDLAEKQKAQDAREKELAIRQVNLDNFEQSLKKQKQDQDERETAIIKKEKEQEEKDAELTKRETAVKKIEKAIAKIPKSIKKFFKSYFTERNKARGFNDFQASDYADDIVSKNSISVNSDQVKYDLQAHDKASVKAFSKALPELGTVIPEVSKIAQSASEYVKTQNKEETKAKAVERVGAVMREGVSPTDHKDVEPSEPDEPDLTDDL